MAEPKGQANAESQPKPKTPEELAADDALASLKLTRVTSTRRLRIDSPNAAWSVVEGANHFEGDVPEDVAKVYAKLIADKVIRIERIDGAGKVHPWTAPNLPHDDGKQH